MKSLDRIWNGRLSGFPSAVVIGFLTATRRLLDRFCTLLWRGNLGALGAEAIVQSGVTVRYPGSVSIGERTSVARGTEMASEFSDSYCLIGVDCIIGRDVRLDFSGGITIGDNVVLSEKVRVFTHSHGIDPKSVAERRPLVVAANVWIGAGALILEGTRSIGEGSIIAAGSVVTGSVPPNVVAGGVPARVIRLLKAPVEGASE